MLMTVSMVVEMLGMAIPALGFLVVIVVAAASHGGTPCFVVCLIFNTL
jgi:hypothetical protein